MPFTLLTTIWSITSLFFQRVLKIRINREKSEKNEVKADPDQPRQELKQPKAEESIYQFVKFYVNVSCANFLQCSRYLWFGLAPPPPWLFWIMPALAQHRIRTPRRGGEAIARLSPSWGNCRCHISRALLQDMPKFRQDTPRTVLPIDTPRTVLPISAWSGQAALQVGRPTRGAASPGLPAPCSHNAGR